MARIGNVEFTLVEDEDRQYDSEVTSHPVEDKQNISDHIRNEPLTYTINGEVTGEGAAEKHRGLLKLRNAKEITSYDGRANLRQCVLESYNTTVDSTIANGFRFSMTIKAINIARPSTVGLLPASLEADTSEVGNAGRVQAQ